MTFDPGEPGQLGERTRLEREPNGPRVAFLDEQFDGWLGDQLITSHPAFAATPTSAQRLEATSLSGFELQDMVTSRGPEFEELYPGRFCLTSLSS